MQSHQPGAQGAPFDAVIEQITSKLPPDQAAIVVPWAC
jgi:hypothetical protein